MENQKLVDQFNKNSAELIKIHINEWKNQEYVDIRIWYLEKPGENGAEIATKKGICINAELLPRLLEALKKAEEVLEKGQDGAEIGSERPQEGRSQED